MEHVFGVRLPDAVMADAGTPRDLASAILAAEPSRPEAVPHPGSVLKTSSGKIRRSATKNAYLSGALPRGRPSARAQWMRLLAGDARVRLGLAVARLKDLAILPADEWVPRPGPVTVAVSPPVKSLGSSWTDIVKLRDEVRDEIACRSGERLVGTRAGGSRSPSRA